MAWYRTGAVTLTPGSNLVLATGSAFLSNVKVGDMFIDFAAMVYEVTAVPSDSTLQISPGYSGDPYTGSEWAVSPTAANLKLLAGQVTDLVAIYQDVPAGVEIAQGAVQQTLLYRNAAVNAQSAAEVARDASEIWRNQAVEAKDGAETAVASIGDAVSVAEEHASVAVQGATDAVVAKNTADASAEAALNAAGQAASSAASAEATVADRVRISSLSAPEGVEVGGYAAAGFQAILDTSVPLQDYAALRSYDGRATRVRIVGVLGTSAPSGICGEFVRTSDSTSTDDGGTIIVDVLGRRWKRVYLGVIRVRWFGAVGNGVADDTVPCNSAIAVASSSRSLGSVVLFDDGVYRITSTLRIDRSGVELRGNNSYGAWSYAPLAVSGSQIVYDANDGADIIVFGTGASWRYRNKIAGIRISAAFGLTTKPRDGVRFNACSEAFVENLNVNGGVRNGLTLNGVTLTTVDRYMSTANENGIRFAIESSIATVNQANWFRTVNLYQSSEDAVLFEGSCLDINFRDSWIEYTKNGFHFKQTVSAITSMTDIQLDNVVVSVGGDFGVTETRFIRGTALNGSDKSLIVGVKARNCTGYDKNSSYNIEFTCGTNTGASTGFEQCSFDGGLFYGALLGVIFSDTGNSNATFTGTTKALNGYGQGSSIPFKAPDNGSIVNRVRITQLTNGFGFLDMIQGGPLRLPQQEPLTYTVEGQVWYQPNRRRLAITVNSERVFLPRPSIEIYNDVNVTHSVVTSPETMVFKGPFTASHTITLDSTLAAKGLTLRVTRLKTATGSFALNVGGLISLAVGQWCDLQYIPSDGWVVAASGVLL